MAITYKSLYEYIFPFVLGKYLEVEWLDHMVGIYAFFFFSETGKEKFEEMRWGTALQACSQADGF